MSVLLLPAAPLVAFLVLTWATGRTSRRARVRAQVDRIAAPTDGLRAAKTAEAHARRRDEDCLLCGMPEAGPHWKWVWVEGMTL